MNWKNLKSNGRRGFCFLFFLTQERLVVSIDDDAGGGGVGFV